MSSGKESREDFIHENLDHANVHVHCEKIFAEIVNLDVRCLESQRIEDSL